MTKTQSLFEFVLRTTRFLSIALLLITVGALAAEAQPFAYVTNAPAPTDVSVIDTASNTVVATVPLGVNGGGFSGVAITPDAAFAYVASSFSGAVSVIDTVSNTVVAGVGLTGEPFGIAITPDGAFAYVANRTGSR